MIEKIKPAQNHTRFRDEFINFLRDAQYVKEDEAMAIVAMVLGLWVQHHPEGTVEAAKEMVILNFESGTRL